MSLLRKRDPMAEAEATVARIEAQRRKLDARLADAGGRLEGAQARRRQALIEGDPSPAEMEALDRAVADAVGAREGILEAARAVAQQLEDAVRARDALVDRGRRAAVAAACERRADAIDDAARRLMAAVEAFVKARKALAATITEHGIARSDVLVPSGYTAGYFVEKIVESAIRVCNPPAPNGNDLRSLVPADYPPDPLIATKWLQSGHLRDVADGVREGRALPVEPSRPAAPLALPTPPAPPVRVVLSRPIAYSVGDGRDVLIPAGGCDVPPEIASAAKAAGLAYDPEDAEAPAIMRALAKLPLSSVLKRIGTGWVTDPGQPAREGGAPVAPETWIRIKPAAVPVP